MRVRQAISLLGGERWGRERASLVSSSSILVLRREEKRDDDICFAYSALSEKP